MRTGRTLALLAALSLPLFAADALDSRAAQLASLRRAVETGSTELGLAKEDLRARLKAIDAQKMEIEVQIRREELRLAQVEGESASRRAELATHNQAGAELVPQLHAGLAAVRAQVQAGLPFRLTDRLDELAKLESQLDAGDLTAETGVARLWAFVEDELRLSRENALDRQIIPLPEGEVLAEVARLGMVALYFHTDGGLSGAAARDGEGWRWVVYTDRDDQKAVETLFEKMRHGIRNGAFTLPNPERSP